jgi:hypothetical protein
VDRLDYALQILLLGFSVVMFTLFLLYGIISLFNRIFYHPAEKQPAGKAGYPYHVEYKPSISELPTRVTAAVTAAVLEYLQLQEAASPKVTVRVQTQETHARRSWAAAGRKILLERRLEHEQLRRKGLR